MATIALENITFSYGGAPVLENVSLKVTDGELHTLLGPSGCGKSTALRLVAGFLRPQKGRILLDGRDITRLPPEKRRMGMVFQNYALFPQMTVAQNIAYGLTVARWPKDRIAERVGRYLKVIGLEEQGNRNAMELSGGQQQRVAIARALAPEPEVLLLDEPLSNLDVELRQRLRDEIRAIQKRVGVTTLFITHDREDALSMSDQVSVMHDHGIAQTGTPREVYEDPATPFVADFLGVMNRIPDAGPDGGVLAVRPEGLMLTAEATDRTVAKGVIRKSYFQGYAYRYTLACTKDGESYPVEVLALNNRQARRFSVGDEAFVEPVP